MFCGVQIQPTTSMTEIPLIAIETDENFQQEASDNELTVQQIGFKNFSKECVFSNKQQVHQKIQEKKWQPLFEEKAHAKFMGLPKTLLVQNKAQIHLRYVETLREIKGHNVLAKTQSKQEKSPSHTVKFEHQGRNEKSHHTAESRLNFVAKQQSRSHTEPMRQNMPTSHREIKTKSSSEGVNENFMRQWKKEETKKWWEERYHQKEREGGNQRQDQQGQHREKKEKKLGIAKSASISMENCPSAQRQAKIVSQRPILAPPKIGIFALYYILTKIGIHSDGASTFACKKEVELIDAEMTVTHKKRLEEIKEAIKKEKEVAQWSVAAKVFSWIASLVSIITGIALIASGVGAVAGALLIAGGTIQLGSQIMDVTGGWSQVANLLPSEDAEKKRAVISWMQIGIGILCLILSGAGAFCRGLTNFMETMQTATALMAGIATMGHGVTTIGAGVIGLFYNNRLSDVKKFDLKLAQLKHMRQDLLDKVEMGIDRLENLFEELARTLEFDEELFQADQMFYRR